MLAYIVIYKRSEFTFLNSFSAWCLLACKKGDKVTPQGKNVKDGTRCYNNPLKKDVCIQGKCLVRRCSCLKYEHSRRLLIKILVYLPFWSDDYYNMEYLAAKAGLRVRNTLHDVNVKAFMRERTKRAGERRENSLFLSLPPPPFPSNPFPLNP